jgi:hypothetical protein
MEECPASRPKPVAIGWLMPPRNAQTVAKARTAHGSLLLARSYAPTVLDEARCLPAHRWWELDEVYGKTIYGAQPTCRYTRSAKGRPREGVPPERPLGLVATDGIEQEEWHAVDKEGQRWVLQLQRLKQDMRRWFETLASDEKLSYPVFMPKPSTHHMHNPGSIIPHIQPKVITDNQMSRIKYNYYINNVSKDYDDTQAKQNSRRLHNTTGMATGATHRLELPIEEFQSIFSF